MSGLKGALANLPCNEKCDFGVAYKFREVSLRLRIAMARKGFFMSVMEGVPDSNREYKIRDF